MQTQGATFGYLVHCLVVRNCQRRGKRYRVWCQGQLLGEFVRKEDVEASVGAIKMPRRGKVIIEQLW